MTQGRNGAAIRRVLATKALRAFGDGYVSLLLPVYLLDLGFDPLRVGVIATATLLGSGLTTMLVGARAHRYPYRTLLLAASALMAATGLGFAAATDFWPLLVIAIAGTLNPSSGDVSVFLPLEHARLAATAQGHDRTVTFARYSLTAALCSSVGALGAAAPDGLVRLGVDHLVALRSMFVVYAAVGLLVWMLYLRLPPPSTHTPADPPAPLDRSRGIVVRLAALFSIDAFAGGLVVQSLLALWLFQRFGLSLAAAGTFFFWSGLLTALSQLAAPWLARRIGLLNTMVFTHIPSSVALIGAALAPRVEMALGLLLLRAALSQMDVPTRSAFVMAVVTPPERAAAASYTTVPRSLASAVSPSLGGALFAAGWLAAPLITCGVLKIAYDLTLLAAFRRVRVDS